MITLICGSMYSGKSKELFRQLERYVFAKKNVVLVRPKKDSRSYLVHKGFMDSDTQGQAVEVPTITTSSFDDIEQNRHLLNESDAIFIDEYFMIKDCVKFITEYGTEKDIFFAGLLATSSCTLFEETIKILPYCDEIVKLNAVCMDCGSQLGNYSYFNGEKVKTEDILVGDKDYKALCLNCYNKSTGALKQEPKELSTSDNGCIRVPAHTRGEDIPFDLLIENQRRYLTFQKRNSNRYSPTSFVNRLDLVPDSVLLHMLQAVFDNWPIDLFFMQTMKDTYGDKWFTGKIVPVKTEFDSLLMPPDGNGLVTAAFKRYREELLAYSKESTDLGVYVPFTEQGSIVARGIPLLKN